MVSCRFFQNKSASWERGQFCQGIDKNCNYQDFSSIHCTFRDRFMAITKKYNDQTQKKIQETKLAGEKKTE